jgi:hypothetical protein
MIVTLQKDSDVMIGAMRRDKLVDNFQVMEITLTIWKVSFTLCKLLILWHHVTRQRRTRFLQPNEGSKYTKEKMSLCFIYRRKVYQRNLPNLKSPWG